MVAHSHETLVFDNSIHLTGNNLIPVLSNCCLHILCMHSWISSLPFKADSKRSWPLIIIINVITQSNWQGACIITIFTAVINSVSKKVSVFVKASQKWLTITKALGYYTTEIITAVKVLWYRPHAFIFSSWKYMAKGSETEVKYMLNHLKVEESILAATTCTMKKMVLKEIIHSQQW